MSTRYRKRPVEVDAIQWTGDNEADVQAFTTVTAPGGSYVLSENFYALDEGDRENCDDPEATATVYDRLHSTWILVYTGQHIVRGVRGELYPIAEDVLAETYDVVDTDFFQPGHTYAREHHGRTIEFHVIHVATAPDCEFPTAFGWRKDPEIDVMLPMDADDFHGCGWVDVTEAVAS